MNINEYLNVCINIIYINIYYILLMNI